jgi:hypothetical protein
MNQPKRSPELQRRLDELKKKEREIEANMLRFLSNQSQLRDDILVVRRQINEIESNA